jgi:hypothetical protein
VLYRIELIAHGSSTPPTRPNKTIITLRSNGQGHIPTASVTPHISTNQASIHQELDANIHVNEQIHKEELVRSTIVSQHGSCNRTFLRKRRVHEALLVIRNN